MTETKSPPTWRRWITPAVCVLLAAGAVGLPTFWAWAELDPSRTMTIGHITLALLALTSFLMLLWFFLFAGFSGRVRLLAVGLAILLAGTAFGVVGEVDWTGDMRPIPRF